MILLSLGIGLVLGFLYYGGLWVTVQRLAQAKRPGLLILGSFLGRIILLIPILLWIANGQFDRLLAAMIGILAMRQVLTKRWGEEKRN
jgi:F1F0 ATPase subunit 2